ncbi:hypothetical protein [Sulfolobus acidocaldarius]|uniref:Conserved protein n=4 Tax=Sulfolobus acidocaldarius TaxID=2285 RepID=Q4J8D9_SULAC|nr:hypothetical protein [Sulfolobus acidocaldarius]AAY80939.1 conserved protein [Sulfolobus acidocaldarius DSM 639]AGE71540.1 hypothetical protein SacN8_07900 [Sulfolobus acidocaldarius N8]AGE73813.1 hypothetical protein SacRon12I_07910 [Sulfolobus acidocaldarius Ron12/I]ALU30232.1 hypothetical protein ATY89_09970 [Sulfolobus acidocaldarius]ALU30947.1 hypothetical protein ATZ20_01525 [Sulfolobus acidocaldarius]
MNKRLYLVLAIIVILITAVGVYASESSYKTTIQVNNLGGSTVDGKYVLEVQVIVNYGPFGGSQPLASAPIWLYYNGKYLNQTSTNNQGIAIFYVQPGNYTVFFTTFKLTKSITVNGNTEVTLNYAYLKV